MITIGINEGINASVVFAGSGNVIFALQEERVNRIKEFTGFPGEALKFGLKYLGLTSADIDKIYVANLDDSLIPTRDQFLKAYSTSANRSLLYTIARAGLKGFLSPALRSYRRSLNRYKNNKENIDRSLLRSLGLEEKISKGLSHHGNHAASAYFGCRQDPDTPHLVLTLDGGGDSLCASVWIGKEGKLDCISQTSQGHSIGNIWSCVTNFMGMRPHEHEYKLMGLAAYADPTYAESVRSLMHSYVCLDPADKLKFMRKIPEETNQIGPRLRRDIVLTRFDSIAGGLQLFTEDILVNWVREAVGRTGIRRVVCAGGVFMNVKANKAIADELDLEYFDVFPSCGDETLPFGAIWSAHAESDPHRGRDIRLESFFLGPAADFDLAHALAIVPEGVQVERLANPEQALADLLADGRIVARCSGRMEFGARALGNRSILADPSNPHVVPIINKMIKQRDFWMPFAPAVLFEKADDYILRSSSTPAFGSPYMMHTFETTAKRIGFSAGVHAYDNTARAQTVDRGRNPDFHRTIEYFAERTGRAVVLNTSFNLHGYPIVMGGVDALQVFLNSGLSHLLIEDHLFSKI